MLTLGRKVGESIVIRTPPGPGREIVVMLASVRNDHGSEKVRLAFTADREVTIHRSEIQAEIDADELASVQAGP